MESRKNQILAKPKNSQSANNEQERVNPEFLQTPPAKRAKKRI